VLRGDVCESVKKGIADTKEADAASKVANVVFILKMEESVIPEVNKRVDLKMKGVYDREKKGVCD
jgi:hypothetical protein